MDLEMDKEEGCGIEEDVDGRQRSEEEEEDDDEVVCMSVWVLLIRDATRLHVPP
jgi:hypothetical protein